MSYPPTTSGVNYHNGPSTSGVLPRLVCLLCGVEILSTDELGMPRQYGPGPTTLEKRRWGRLWRLNTQEHLIISSDEVERADVFPRLWLCLYRAIIMDSATKYHLTGISSVSHCHPPYQALNDPTKARIRGKKNSRYDDRVFIEFYAADKSRQPRQLKNKTIGFAVHAHCSSLLGQVEGLDLHSVNLVKLVRVCRKYWRDHRFDWDLSSNYTDLYEIESSLPSHWKPHYIDVSQSPLTVPAIQQAMDSIAKTGCNDISSRLNILPLELMILIAEYVCPVTHYTVEDVRALRNMLLVFRWELPKSFWRERLNECLFFELKGKSSWTEWKLRLALMSIIAGPKTLESSGLVNRDRVLRILRDLKEAYIK